MRKNMYLYNRLLFFFLPGLLFIFGCQKIPMDYRNPYVGKYSLKVTLYQWDAGQGTYVQTEKITQGEIYYEKGKENKHIICIRYAESTEPLKVKIDNLGFVFAPCDVRIGQIQGFGHLYVSWSSGVCPGGGLGGGDGIVLEGDKL